MVAGKHRTARQHGHFRPAPDLPATTPLMLRLHPDFDRKEEKIWRDDDEGRLEARICPIAAAIIVAGEAAFRRRLGQEEARLAREQHDRQKRRQDRLAELNRLRLNELRASGELLRQAGDIRALVARARLAIIEGRTEIDMSALDAWERWALAEADRIDPVLSGQFMTHFHEPKL